MVVDSDMPGQDRAEMFRACGKVVNQARTARSVAGTRKMRGLVHISKILKGRLAGITA